MKCTLVFENQNKLINSSFSLKVFLVHPAPVTAVDGTTVEFSCTAENTEEIVYKINGSSASVKKVHDKGFVQLPGEPLDGSTRRRNLTVFASSLYNNTDIFCRAYGVLLKSNSEIVSLTVQGEIL